MNILCDKRLMTATQATNTQTGEVIKLTPSHKMVYFYLNNHSGTNESWESILSIIGLPYERKGKRIINDLHKIGLVARGANNQKFATSLNIMKDWTFSNPKMKTK